MILYHYTNLNPFFGDDEQAEAARQALGRGEQPPRAFTVLRPSSTQHPEWKPVVWLTSEPDVDRGRVPDELPIIYVRITVVVKSTDRRLMPRQKAYRNGSKRCTQASLIRATRPLTMIAGGTGGPMTERSQLGARLG